jgi:hypothetical protein
VRNKIISSVGVAVGVTVVLIVNRFQPMVPSAAVGFGSGVGGVGHTAVLVRRQGDKVVKTFLGVVFIVIGGGGALLTGNALGGFAIGLVVTALVATVVR